MRRLLITALLFLAALSRAVAGDYYAAHLDTYDPATGLYFKAVSAKPEAKRGILSIGPESVVIDVAIFDPSDNSTKYALKQTNTGTVVAVLFESGFREGVVQFNGAGESHLAKNNHAVPKREPRNKLLIAIRRPDTTVDLLVADKRGQSAVRLAVVPPGASWHIDVRNSKLRVLSQHERAIKVESFEW